MPATLQLAATTLRSIIGRMELDEVLAKRAEINTEVQEILESRVEQWGVNITAVEIKDISLPAEMKRAMARQAEAERERRAKIIMSEGELQAAPAAGRGRAADADDPAALQLRLYQTMVEVAAQPNMTIVLPVPIELLASGKALLSAGAAGTPVAAAVNAAAQALSGATAKQLAEASARQLADAGSRPRPPRRSRPSSASRPSRARSPADRRAGEIRACDRRDEVLSE